MQVGDSSRFLSAFPARLAVIYVLHQPAFIGSVVRLLSPFLRQDSLQQKFVLLGSDYAKLHEHLPSERLPADLQGYGTGQGFGTGQGGGGTASSL